MSSTSATAEAISAQTELARLNRDKVRETLEKLHSQSNDLMHFAVNWNDLECRFDSIQKSIDGQVDEMNQQRLQLEWKSKYLKNKLNEVELKSGEIQLRENELEAEKKQIDDRCDEIDHTYQLVAMCHERAEETAQGLEVKLRKLKHKEEILISKLNKVGKREERLILKRKLMKRKFGSLKIWKEELVIKEKRMIDRVGELNLREAKLNSIEREIFNKVQDFESREKKLKETEIQLRNQDKLLQERYKVFINNERCLNTVLARLRGEEIFDADIRFYVTMNGRDLIDFLNSHANDLEIMRDEVTRALKLSSNPAKLVLDAMQAFYGDNSQESSDMSVVRSSCIVLLEQLTELEPQIMLPERERARLLALGWKAEIKEDIYHNLEVVGFLELVCAYRLTYEFDIDELAKTVEAAAYYTRAPALCRRLGLADKVHGIVEHLIEDKHAVEAVRFIKEFNLADTFPPVPILRNFMRSVLSAADNMSELDPFNKEEATYMILSALVAVIKCIKELKLDSEFPTENLEKQVSELQMQIRCSPPQIQKSYPLTARKATENLSPVRRPISITASVPEALAPHITRGNTVSGGLATNPLGNVLQIVDMPIAKC